MLPTDENVPEFQNELALRRTSLALERTLLAWVRTATGLIAFGFSMLKFFEYQTFEIRDRMAQGIIGPRGFAILMMSAGLIALGLAFVEHVVSRRRLGVPRNPLGFSLAGVLAAIIGVLGCAGLVSALTY